MPTNYFCFNLEAKPVPGTVFFNVENLGISDIKYGHA